MAGFQSVIVDDTSGAKAEVLADKRLQVNMPVGYDDAGHACIAAENDDGTYLAGVRNVMPAEVDADFRVRVGSDQPIYQESCSGTALNSGRWSSTVTTMTTAVASGYIKLNNGASAAANAVARIQSYRYFQIYDSFSLALQFSLNIAATSLGILNTTWEIGFFIASGTSAPTDGVFLRMNASGELRLVQNFAGVETQSDPIIYDGSLQPNDVPGLDFGVDTNRKCVLVVGSTEVEFWIDDQLIASSPKQSSVPNNSSTLSLPIAMRIYNSASVPATGTQLWVGNVSVSTISLASRGWYHVLGFSGHGSYDGQSGATLGQTANYTNSAEPSNATLSNTAAGYTTLGGQWSFAAPAGAVTDYALFGYQVPAGAATAHNKNLRIDRVSISSVNVGAAVATTATVIQWALGVHSTAVSLATAEAATTRAPRRIPIGMQAFVVGDAIGASANQIVLDVSSAPVYVEPGSYIHIIARVPVGTATASQVIRGTCTIVGQWDA